MTNPSVFRLVHTYIIKMYTSSCMLLCFVIWISSAVFVRHSDKLGGYLKCFPLQGHLFASSILFFFFLYDTSLSPFLSLACAPSFVLPSWSQTNNYPAGFEVKTSVKQDLTYLHLIERNNNPRPATSSDFTGFVILGYCCLSLVWYHLICTLFRGKYD